MDMGAVRIAAPTPTPPQIRAATNTAKRVYQGTTYLTMDETTMAIDASNCRPRWTHTWTLKDGALSKVNRGVALKDGRLVRGTPDGYLIELNMADGSLLWSRKIADSKSAQYLSMPPMILENRIIYGPAGADWGAKNWVGAFDLTTGEPARGFSTFRSATRRRTSTRKPDPATTFTRTPRSRSTFTPANSCGTVNLARRMPTTAT